MTLDLLRSFFLWCTIINFAILWLWFGSFIVGRNWMKRTHSRWFNLSDQQFDAIHYSGIAFFKIGIILLNLVPAIVLHLIGG